MSCIGPIAIYQTQTIITNLLKSIRNNLQYLIYISFEIDQVINPAGCYGNIVHALPVATGCDIEHVVTKAEVVRHDREGA